MMHSEYQDVAVEFGIEPAALRAVVEVESAGVVGDPNPVIRIEGHYFYRRLSGTTRDLAVKLGYASPSAGAVKNPSTQTDRYAMLAKMCEIDREAALESTSWGVGQVMGSNWEALGYPSVDALVAEAKSGLAGQVRLMCKFIQVNKLIDELQTKDWPAFARAYNGPSYAKYGYDKKMAAAYAKYSAEAPQADLDTSTPGLSMGAKGDEVILAQDLLRQHGYMLDLDGDFGPRTRDIVMLFQKDNGLTVTGIITPDTWNLLEVFNHEPQFTEPGKEETKLGAVATGVGITAATAAELGQAIGATSDAFKAFGSFADVTQTIALILMGVGAVITLYGIYRKSTEDQKPA